MGGATDESEEDEDGAVEPPIKPQTSDFARGVETWMEPSFKDSYATLTMPTLDASVGGGRCSVHACGVSPVTVLRRGSMSP